MNDELHNRAREAFEEALLCELRGSPEAAREKYEIAAALEEKCVEGIGDDEPRSRGILSVSAVSLWSRAGNLEHAEQLARHYVSSNLGPGFQRELFELLSDIRLRKQKETHPEDEQAR